MAKFESTGQILGRAIKEIICPITGHIYRYDYSAEYPPLFMVRLTDYGRAECRADDTRRARNGFPARQLHTVKELGVCEFYSPGCVFVRCPNRSEGFAVLMFDEFEVSRG